MMKKMLLMLMTLALMGSVSAIAAEEAKQPIEPKEKIELFNGKDLGNWNIWLKDENAKPADTFKVEAGLIKCSGAPFGYIRSKDAYKNYVLTVEWRFVKEGNTGLILHVSGENKTWPKGLEAQGMHGKQGDLVAFPDVKFENMSKKGLVTPRTAPDAEKPVGEWNEYKVVFDGANARVYVNGKLVNQANGLSVTSGDICLQSEGSVWEGRKVTLEPLSAAPKAEAAK